MAPVDGIPNSKFRDFFIIFDKATCASIKYPVNTCMKYTVNCAWKLYRNSLNWGTCLGAPVELFSKPKMDPKMVKIKILAS